MSDEGNLAESAYELINSTDGESQDGQISESVSSLDYPRTDDVQSLNGSTHEYHTDTDEDGEVDDHNSSASSIRYADQALQNPSSSMPSGSLQFKPTPEASILPQSIEFLEAEADAEADRDGHVYVEKISVKHTIREFDEQETTSIVQDLELLNEAPKRLVATIRQTMSQACLSTRVPLRVMYTGSPAALTDIVHKLSSAIWTSSVNNESGKDAQRNDTVYNIVPISSFGSDKVPEIQLMASSGYQIRVEHCTKAEEVIIDGGSFPGDTVYCVTVDQDKTYKSLFSPSGSIIQPKWALPHVAIFFCTENDGEEADTTRNVAWEFMSRHGVPSIFICNNQTFTKPPNGRWRDFVDQHAVHLCLESRDPDRPIPAQRLPIDLASFLNIDARQMNRNLAYLTGLSEQHEETRSDAEPIPVKSTSFFEDMKLKELQMSVDSPSSDMKQWAVNFYQRHRQHVWSLAMTLLSLLVYTWLQSSGLLSKESPPLPTTAVAPVPSVLSTVPAATTTTTVIINVTSTKTVKLQRPDASVSPLASALSFAGLLSDKTSTATVAEPEATKTVCTVELYGNNNNEILVRIPTSKKSAWLARGAIDIDVLRGEESIKAKLSSVDEGIVVELNKKDAYGLLNVSVITTRRPKINETFEVNFGNSAVVEALEAAAQLVLGMRDKAVYSGEQVLHSGADMVQSAADSIVKVAHTVQDGVRVVDHTVHAAAGKVAEAGQAAQSYTRRTVGVTLDSLHPKHLANRVKSARKRVRSRLTAAEAGAELTVLKAQIASKLWSLKIQGKTEEYAKYEKKAADFLKKKHEDVAQTLKSDDGKAQQMKECGCSGSKRKSRHCPNKCASPRKTAPKAGGRWKKLVVG
jgi:hypothetical protein